MPLLLPRGEAASLAFIGLLWRLGTHRIHQQHGLEPPAKLANLRGLETGVQNRAQGITVPMAMAHAAGREWHKRILDPRDHPSMRANMFEKQEHPSRLEHAPDLA